MRIAQVIGTLEAGGAEALVRDLSAALRGLGHEVEVVLLDRFSGSSRERESVRYLLGSGVTVISLGRLPRWPGVAGAARLAERCVRSRYEVVHSHVPLADAIVAIVRRLVSGRFTHVVTVHNTREDRSRAIAALSRRAAIVYCSGAAQAANKGRLGAGQVVRNGIDLSQMAAAEGEAREIRKSLRLSENSKLVLGVGSLTPRKNYACGIRAVERISRERALDVHYAICGEGPSHSQLRLIASECGAHDRVHFLGARTDIPALLAAADCFLSVSQAEGLPIAVIEAMTSGTPVVLSPIEEHMETAAGVAGCGFALENEPASVSEALLRMLGETLSHESLRSLRQPSLQRFSIQRCAEEYVELYRRIMGAAPEHGFRLARPGVQA